MSLLPAFLLAVGLTAAVYGQRITTIQLDGVSYFISRMNPYSPELNYFLAYQYCRSIGLQLASFETKEKADSITQYLINAGYSKYDFWTSGNRLGTDMMIWMSTGLPFNATFDYMRKAPGEESLPVARQLGAVEQRKDSGSADGCVALRAPDLVWDTDDCTAIKDFICEQTRCYYYNYGSIPVSAAQGSKRMRSSTRIPTSTASSAKNHSIDSTMTNASYSIHSSTTVYPTYSSSTSDTSYNGTAADSTYSSTTTDTPHSNITSDSSYSSSTSDSTYSSTMSDSTYSSTTSDLNYSSTTSDPTLSSTISDLSYSSTTSESAFNSTPDIYNNTSTDFGSSASNESSTLEYSATDMPPCDPDPVSNGNPKSRSSTASQTDTEETIPWSWARNIMLEKPVLKKSASL